jgi:hypothetical protein
VHIDSLAADVTCRVWWMPPSANEQCNLAERASGSVQGKTLECFEADVTLRLQRSRAAFSALHYPLSDLYERTPIIEGRS